jgi:hypothetical protein
MRFYISSKDLDDRDENDADTELSSMIDEKDSRSSFTDPSKIAKQLEQEEKKSQILSNLTKSEMEPSKAEPMTVAEP